MLIAWLDDTCCTGAKGSVVVAIANTRIGLRVVLSVCTQACEDAGSGEDKAKRDKRELVFHGHVLLGCLSKLRSL